MVLLQMRQAPNSSSSSNRTTRNILWGAWLQAVGPIFIVLLHSALVHLAEATSRLAGWMTLFDATVLMTMSLFDAGFYIGALNPEPAMMPFISLTSTHSSSWPLPLCSFSWAWC
jgi:hypothetical protein